MGHELQDTTDVTMQYQNKLLTPSSKVSKVPRVTHDREEKMAADNDGNSGSKLQRRTSAGHIYKPNDVVAFCKNNL